MKKYTTYLVALLLLSFSACKNDDSTEPNNSTKMREQQVPDEVIETERLINELEFVARSIRTAYPNQPGLLSGANITQGFTDEGKHKFDITFNGITGPDNKKRNGKLTVVFENTTENGSVIVGKHLHVRSDDENNLYSIDGVKFKGSLIFSNITAAKASSATTIDHLNAQSFIIKPNAGQIRFSSQRKTKWIAGSSTLDINDDIFESTDQTYSLAIENQSTTFIEVKPATALTLNFTCQQSLLIPKKGKLKLETLGKNTSYLLFGEGNCSDTISLSSL